MKAFMAVPVLLPCASIAFSKGPTGPAAGPTRLPGHRQTLFFKEARTGVPVHLVGTMHYNPHSIAKVERLLTTYAADARLGAVVLESCAARWDALERLQPEDTLLRRLFDNEFQAAAAFAGGDDGEGGPVRLVLADEGIRASDERVRASFAATLADLADPPRGWERLAADVRGGCAEGFGPPPVDGTAVQERYLDAEDFFDAGLLVCSPISLFRYIVGFVAKKPLPGSLLLAWLAVLAGYGAVHHGAGDATAAQEVQTLSAALALNLVLGVPLLGRVLLIALLADRNTVLAANVRRECERLRAEGRGDAVCVVVLGLAHCNGVKRRLRG